jgi:tetratricopeptide (TPR) repeat protein
MRVKQAMIAGGIGTASLIAFGIFFSWIASEPSFGPRQQLRLAMELLDDGRWDLAGRIARDQERSGATNPEEDSAWQYVMGVSKLQSVAEDLDSPKNRKVLLEATSHLKKADELGFPLGYQGKGRFFLGFCLFNTYRWDEAANKLLHVPRDWPDRRSDAYRMIIDSQLQKQSPSHREALATLKQWQNVPGMSQRERASMHMTQARLALATNDLEQCENLLGSISSDLPEYWEAMLWRGRWRVEAAERAGAPLQRATLTDEAASILRTVILAADTPNTLRRQATYLSGRNQRLQGNLKEALGTFSGVRQRNPYSAESIAAGIEEAEVLLESRNLGGAVNTIHHILRNIEDIRLYNGYWVSETLFKSRLLNIARKLREEGEYDRVIELADFMGLAFPRSDTLRLQAETFERWGDDLAARPSYGRSGASEEQRRELYGKYRMAAETFEQLAEVEMRSNDYPQIVWQSAENFRKANDLTNANRQLANYLKNESRLKRARGLVALGRNYLHAGEWQKAVEPLERCLTEYGTSPASYEARLLAAQAKTELGELEAAIELLESNLADFKLDPTSPVWQDSLFELAEITFTRGDELLLRAAVEQKKNASATAPAGTSTGIEDRLKQSHDRLMTSVKRLREAYSRYPDDPRYFSSRYLLARSYRMAAKMPELIAKSNTNLVDSARRELLQQRRSLLEQALAEYRGLHVKISDRNEYRSANDEMNALLRNCFFGEADTLFELSRWEEASDAYRRVASRYLNQPESLEALVQLAICHRKLGREFEAKKTLAQAEQVLKRIPAEQEQRFVAHTRASRPEWERLITWLQKWN